jgi:hypothetical protein
MSDSSSSSSSSEAPFVMNQSRLKTYLNCNRLYGWQYLQQLEPVGKRSALEIGTAAHTGLALLHAEGGTVELALAKAKEQLSERSGIQSRFADMDLAEADAIMTRTLEAYFRHWQGQGQMWTPLNQEVGFMVEVGTGTNIFLRGRADNLSIMGGALYIVDYKTAGKMDPRDLLKYELDIQLSAYIYGLSKQLSAESAAAGGPPVRVEGAIIDLLVKTQTPQFARESYTRTEEELAEFELEFIEYGTRLRSQHARVAGGEAWKIVFPKNTDACFRYGTCAFRDLCLKDTPIRRLAYNQRKPDYVDEATAELASKKAGEA